MSFRSLFPALLAAAALTAPLPALAQFSPSHSFIEALKKKDDKAALEAIDKKIDLNATDSVSRETGLHIVTAQRRADWIAHLIGLGANIDARDAKGQTPLQVAVNVNFTQGAGYLIQHGARLDESNNVGETPLITAVHNRNLELIKLLLVAGANVDRADNSGRTARDYALLDGGRGGSLATAIEASAKARTAAGLAKPKPKYGPSL